ncbi:hypothetical protein J2X54_004553 [Duganella sp. 3397]|uniref:DUF4148 domain-containing protein n=1 Tax=Duganella phyllosphaerae TaxID=762836 RepID=A0A1E7WI18_9BURK|nr:MULTISPECIES: hypothetical protein [Duganella]MDR7052051.1 hypothetical protein [Duganella sp. 3397]OEZ98270.1 hypothetical protein DUPY_32150 [Duganella phyllosphaerae]
MSTTTKDLLRAAATVVFAIAATATTVTSAFAAEAATGTTAVAAKADQPHQLTRAEVQAQVIEARKNGTLLETEADFDVAQTRKQVAR